MDKNELLATLQVNLKEKFEELTLEIDNIRLKMKNRELERQMSSIFHKSLMV